ncbi:MAG: ABC transporter ATP-binding protein [Sulfolobales archaeon]
MTLGGSDILRGISFRTEEGLIMLIGSNGSGKTTLLKTLAGLIESFRGSLRINERDIRSMKRKEIARLIGFVWQNPYYGFIEPRVYDEIILITRILNEKNYDKEIIERLVDPQLFNRDPFTLSGGEAKRVSIASILIMDQPIWLLDEPFDYLDMKGVIDLIDLIREKRRRKIIIISSVNTGYIRLIEPDKIMLLERGELKYFGDAEHIEDKILESSGVMSRRMICGE